MNDKRIIVMGSGLIGRLIVEDLLAEESFRVVAVDGSSGALDRLGEHPRLSRRQADLASTEAVEAIAKEGDLVVGAVPGFLGRGLQRGVLAARRPLVDICFAPENPLDLHDEVQAEGLPFIVDCGLAPGLSNLLVGREAAAMSTVDEVLIMVGGLPERRDWPWEYRFVFSPGDVIEEYTRPCRLRIAGREITGTALSEVEPVDFPGVGTLEAFLTDGLRTLMDTIPAPTMREKTLRYPGHAERMRALRDTGFFDTKPMDLEGCRVSPRALTEQLFRRAMTLAQGDRELTVLRVQVSGTMAGGEAGRVTWDLLDRTDGRGRTSMARTTGFPAALAVRLVASGVWRQPGVCPPETLGADSGACEALLAGLARRGIDLQRREEKTAVSSGR